VTWVPVPVTWVLVGPTCRTQKSRYVWKFWARDPIAMRNLHGRQSNPMNTHGDGTFTAVRVLVGIHSSAERSENANVEVTQFARSRSLSVKISGTQELVGTRRNFEPHIITQGGIRQIVPTHRIRHARLQNCRRPHRNKFTHRRI
jgi:hypothetical protein